MERSPYLLQHSHNPVDWYPWGAEAFETAERLDRPIFLSIGYSSCHWCHVMERECFEDPDVARMMNDWFINIKVDREERPDVDSLYMKVCQMMTGGGGWPLTILMTPERVPFWAGTYLPKSSRQGMPGMIDLLPAVNRTWKERREDIKGVTVKVMEMLDSFERDPTEGDVFGLVDLTLKHMSEDFEPRYGGFDGERKFPSPHKLLFLLRFFREKKDQAALDMAVKTMDNLVRGGIRDHLGGGFHRYSTDHRWHLPHFEKMLYDQALVLMALAEAYAVTGDREYRQAGSDLIGYVKSVLTSHEGGFFSSEDADSEGREGAFYLWRFEELSSLLSADDLARFKELYDVWDSGNFRDEATRTRSGLNVLHRTVTLREYASSRGSDPEEIYAWDEKIRNELRAHRENRPRPALDDKVLTDWNALMVVALCMAHRYLGRNDVLALASDALEFLEGRMVKDGVLYHSYRQGEVGTPSLLDDHACLAWAHLEMYYETMKKTHLERCLGLVEEMMVLFLDREDGGFYLSRDDPDLLMRMKDLYDGASPSGNSIAYYVLVQLAALFNDIRAVEALEGTERHFLRELRLTPSAYSMFMCGVLMKEESRTLEVFGRSEPAFPGYHPHLLTVKGEHLEGQPGISSGYRLCLKGACLPETEDRKEIERLLE
jgi:uncharacterized protein YyaL (SSP411 family)